MKAKINFRGLGKEGERKRERKQEIERHRDRERERSNFRKKLKAFHPSL